MTAHTGAWTGLSPPVSASNSGALDHSATEGAKLKLVKTAYWIRWCLLTFKQPGDYTINVELIRIGHHTKTIASGKQTALICSLYLVQYIQYYVIGNKIMKGSTKRKISATQRPPKSNPQSQKALSQERGLLCWLRWFNLHKQIYTLWLKQSKNDVIIQGFHDQFYILLFRVNIFLSVFSILFILLQSDNVFKYLQRSKVIFKWLSVSNPSKRLATVINTSLAQNEIRQIYNFQFKIFQKG